MADQTVTLRITANAQGLVTGVALAKRETQGLGEESERTGRRASAGMAAARSAIQSINHPLALAKQTVIGFVGAFASIQGVRALVGMADTWSDLTSRVRLSIPAHENASNVMRRLHSVAQQTYSSFELTAETYTRNATTLNALGVSTQRQLDYTQALNNALVVSGAKAERAEQVQSSLAKALAEGSLRGEDFNNVLNYGSRVAEVMANELGVNVTELRGMAAEGKITGNVILNSLIKNMETLTEEAESMPTTVGDAFVLIRNSVLALVGSTDEAAGSTGWMAEQLVTVSRAIDIIAPEVQALASLWSVQADEQTGVATSAEDIAYGMKTVVTGLILAKNAADVVIAGFRLLVGVAVAAAAEMIDSFDDVAKIPGIMRRALDPRTAKQALEEYAALIAGGAGRTKRFADEVKVQVALFSKSWETNVDDVSKAFGFLEGGLQNTKEATDATVDSAKSALVTGALTKEQISALTKAATDYIEKLREELATLGLSSAAMVEHDIATRKLTDGQAAEARSIHAQIAARKAWLALEEKAKTASQSLAEKIAAQREQTLQQRDALAGLSQAQIAYNAAMREVDAMRQNAVGPLPEFDIAQVDALGEAITEAFTIDQALADFSDLQDIIQRVADTNMGGLARDILQIEEALKRGTDAAGNAFSTEQIERMSSALATMRKEQLHANIDAYIALGQAVVGGMKDAAEQGTRHYAALEVAQSALALAQGINAILNQGQGDPYSAFGRMAAMAATVIPLAAQLGASISNFASTGFTDTAGQRQQSQGTGTVLGDSAAKSESIARAVEITADATRELVGINRGMLNALQAMQAGVGSASGMLARGGNSLEFSALPDTRFSMAETLFGSTIGGVLDSVFGGLFGSISDKLLGGKSKITDQGIVILGGALSQMIEDISVGAYQEVQYKKWAFGSTKTREEVQALGDDISVQFQLVLDSMADAVREGARALGLNMEEVNRAIEQYQIAEIRISTQGLSGEEAQAELEAVFSSIFDGLAGSIVPFIDQFQRVGEGLGETLVRVATGVQVTQEAVKQLGFALDEADPEKFAQASEGLIALVGGIDEFISGMSSFVNAFATDEHKFAVAQEALNSAFAQAGLEVPATRDAMWDLMQTLDATTDSGREQIATLLRLAGVADDYYSALEDQQAAATRAAEEQAEAARAAAEAIAQAEANYQALLGNVRDMLDVREMSEFALSIRDVRRWSADTTKALHEAARAAGRLGAAEEDLSLVRDEANARIAEALAALRESMIANATALGYIDAPDTLDYLNQRIGELQNASANAASGIGAAVDTIRNELDLLLGDLSPYSDRQKLEMARAGLQAGSVTQEQFLAIAQRLFGRSSRYAEEFAFAQQYPGGMGSGDGYNPATGTTTSSDARSLQELIAARDALMAAQQYEMAQTLARQLAEYSAFGQQTYAEIAAMQNWNLEQLATTLGLNSEELTTYLDTLAATFHAQDFASSAASIVDAVIAGSQGIIDAVMGSYDPAAFAGEEPGYDEKYTQQIQPIATVPVTAIGNESGGHMDALLEEVRSLRAEVTSLREQATRGADAGEATADAAIQTAENTRQTTAALRDLAQTRPGARRSTAGVV